MPPDRRPHFNLLDEPWIPCEFPTGEVRPLGIRELLDQARTIRSLAHPSPLVLSALMRLLLALLHRIHDGPKDVQEWLDIWRSQSLLCLKAHKYLEKWADRFWLFHSEKPFYQSPIIAEAIEGKENEQDPMSKMKRDLSHGNKGTLFDHTTHADQHRVPEGEAAQLLLAMQLGDFSGTGGGPNGKKKSSNYSDAPAARSALIFLEGRTLFETLVLNMCFYNEDEPFRRAADDRPAWECEPLDERIENDTARGYIDLLTWQARRILLLRDGDEESATRVARCVVWQGRSRHPDDMQYEPLTRVTPGNDKKAPWRHLRVEKDRALWRDLHAILEVRDDQRDERKGAMPHRPLFSLAEVMESTSDPRMPEEISVVVRGACPKPGQNLIYLWVDDHFRIPTVYLTKPESEDLLREAITAAESIARALVRAEFAYARAWLESQGKTPKDKDVEKFRKQLAMDCARAYWPRLEEYFPRTLRDIPNSPEDTLKRWEAALRDESRSALSDALRTFRMDARTIRASRAAWLTLYRNQRRMLGRLNDKEALDERKATTA